jgi:ssDNA-binding Zn-finger/Zn-ribbon topoisomerase 1
MIWIFAAVVIMTIVLFALTKLTQKHEPAQSVSPFQKAEALFSPAERSFLGVLQQAVGNDTAILGKVRVADVVQPKTGLGRSAWKKAFNKISAKHFDFLLCHKENLSVRCAIEWVDGSHDSKSRHQRDEFLKKVCVAAGVPLVQIPAKSGYVVSEVKRLIPRHLITIDSPIPEAFPDPTPQEAELNAKICPNCSAVMAKRVANKGRHAGKVFWACSAFPKCKTVEPTKA